MHEAITGYGGRSGMERERESLQFCRRRRNEREIAYIVQKRSLYVKLRFCLSAVRKCAYDGSGRFVFRPHTILGNDFK